MLRRMASFDPTSIVRLHGLNTLPKSSDRLHFLIVNHPWPLVDYDSRFSIVLLLFQRYLINSIFLLLLASVPGADATVLEETTISLGGAVLSSLEKVGKATSSEHKVRNEIVLVLFYTVVPGFLHLRRFLD